MRITRSTDVGASSATQARYRVDFFAVVHRSGARPPELGPTDWWVVQQVHIDQADAAEVLAWAEREAGADGRYVVYLEQFVAGESGELTVRSRIAGTDPRSTEPGPTG